jgi:hypothetical protein
MASAWIEFVKKYSKDNKMSYSEALKKAGPEYKKRAGSKSEPAKKEKAPMKEKKEKAPMKEKKEKAPMKEDKEVVEMPVKKAKAKGKGKK